MRDLFDRCRPDRDTAGRMRTIETGRLTLEPQTAAHADAMFAVLSGRTLASPTASTAARRASVAMSGVLISGGVPSFTTT